MSYSVGQLHKYAVNLYKELEEETGQNVGFSVVSNIRLASTKDRICLLYTSPSPRDRTRSRMPSSA